MCGASHEGRVLWYARVSVHEDQDDLSSNKLVTEYDRYPTNRRHSGCTQTFAGLAAVVAEAVVTIVALWCFGTLRGTAREGFLSVGS